MTAAVLWGFLPIALKIVLQGLDPYTTTWYRFAISGILLGIILGATGNLPRMSALSRRANLMLAIGLSGLAGNYVLYVVGLAHTTPTIAQTVIQLGPMMLLFGGLVIFNEHFSPGQWIGFAV